MTMIMSTAILVFRVVVAMSTSERQESEFECKIVRCSTTKHTRCVKIVPLTAHEPDFPRARVLHRHVRDQLCTFRSRDNGRVGQDRWQPEPVPQTL